MSWWWQKMKKNVITEAQVNYKGLVRCYLQMFGMCRFHRRRGPDILYLHCCPEAGLTWSQTKCTNGTATGTTHEGLS